MILVKVVIIYSLDLWPWELKYWYEDLPCWIHGMR
jgi:hypothetical protein